MNTTNQTGRISTYATGCGCYGTPVQKDHPNTGMFNQQPKDIMTPEEVCEFLCIDTDTLSAMVRGYQIPVVRLKKGLYRFSRRQIESWLDDKAIQKLNEED